MPRLTTRPSIDVKEDALRKLRAFAERHDLSRSDVYGYAIEAFADDLDGANDEIAEKIVDSRTTAEE